MKRLYNIIFVILCLVVAMSFLPWLYSIVFPSNTSDPFVLYSPVSDSFVVSEIGGDNTVIYTVDAAGNRSATALTKNDRDSLAPQMYFNQLNARNALPDSVAGREINIPLLKNGQWVFSSLPRDINRVQPRVYPIMESRPKRVDLEDPVEVFTLDDGIRFIDMATNKENADRNRKFAKVFADRGFAFPAVSANANITARKAYDEGYLLIDSQSGLYHMKMQAGQPYLAVIEMPKGVEPRHAFILENPDMKHIGLVTTADGGLYVIERDGYKPVQLPIDSVGLERQRITIMKNIFNWVVKLTDKEGSRWIAIDSDDYSLLGEYRVSRSEDCAQKAARWIFPFRLSFTDIDDCYVYPRISDFSLPATIVWLLIALAICFLPKIIKSKK